ncbi:hypothetical protein [Streptomyces sp. G-G2]|uniref:hypothetical protein n=1 Tax=Streptomyces sp. G-G2 TaxID=3046201 RepID=UPI0024BB5282|nr:hypothetical protein [Streptomyces sp. G-G2]MDJ0379756.1 hypothetical protein [Streptomyces sp. G-G2]
MKLTIPDDAPWYCGAYTFLPLDAVETHRKITGRDLSDYMVECIRDQGHEGEHSGTIRGSGSFHWDAQHAVRRRADRHRLPPLAGVGAHASRKPMGGEAMTDPGDKVGSPQLDTEDGPDLPLRGSRGLVSPLRWVSEPFPT